MGDRLARVAVRSDADVSPLSCSEKAEIVGQHLTLPRWILILLARINGLKSINHSSGEDRSDRAGDRGNLVGVDQGRG